MMGLWILVLLGLGGLSARWNWWRTPKKGIPILMYHKIGVPPEGSKLAKLWVSPEKFRAQLAYLKKHGFTPVVFNDLYAHWDGHTSLPEKPVLITFDDGYLNNYTEAFPVLKEFGYPATLFVVVNTVGGDNKWHNPESETRIPMVTWNQLIELKTAGWEIGSHTMNHRNLAKASLSEVTEEMTESKKKLEEKLGAPIFTFAYPYGAGEDRPDVRQEVKNAGYRIAVGVHPGLWTHDEIKDRATHLPRNFVRGEENMFDFHLQMTRGQSRL